MYKTQKAQTIRQKNNKRHSQVQSHIFSHKGSRLPSFCLHCSVLPAQMRSFHICMVPLVSLSGGGGALGPNYSYPVISFGIRWDKSPQSPRS